jgi:hypothetical protein
MVVMQIEVERRGRPVSLFGQLPGRRVEDVSRTIALRPLRHFPQIAERVVGGVISTDSWLGFADLFASRSTECAKLEASFSRVFLCGKSLLFQIFASDFSN